MARVKGHRFDAFDRPAPVPLGFYAGRNGGVIENELIVLWDRPFEVVHT
jgi:hypothetical protein